MGGEKQALTDHYTQPQNMGDLPEADLSVLVTNDACGDELYLYASVDGEEITTVRFRAFGCAPAVAAGSVLTEMIKGQKLEEIATLTRDDIDRALGGLPPLKQHCALLAEDAIKALLKEAAQYS